MAVLKTFNFNVGESPECNLFIGGYGALYGTTYQGGGNGYSDGTVFEIDPLGSVISATTLASFGPTSGSGPKAGLVTDSAGDLFGTTSQGGVYGDGTVFEIANTSSGYASTPTVLVGFGLNDNNGVYYPDVANIDASLLVDAAGNLLGTSRSGGPAGDGTIFEVPYAADGRYAVGPTVLVNFDGTDGSHPVASLIADPAGNLFGTTLNGGAYGGYGTVFEIVTASGGYATTPTTLVSFNGTDGNGPEGSLVADAAGNLFGTTVGGGTYGFGTVFEIAKTSGGYANTPTVLVNFNSTNGANPIASLIVDAAGDLFGTTSGGGASGDGTVFEIARTSSGYSTTPTILVDFNGQNGSSPMGGLTADAGNLFGTTESGGSGYGYGTAFEIESSGFVVGAWVTSVAASPATAVLVGGGAVVVLTMTLSEAVTVSGGIPTLQLNDGGTANYTGGSGTNQLTFQYTVASGQSTPDLAVTGSALNGAVIADAAGIASNLVGASMNLAGTLQIDAAAARTLSWNGTGNTNLATPSNWNDVSSGLPATILPTSMDTVVFNNNEGGISGTGTVATIDVGSVGAGVMEFIGGDTLVGGSLDVGVSAADVGQIGLTGTGTSLMILGSAVIADDGSGVLSVLSGATFSAHDLTIGSQGTSSGVLTVSGIGSAVHVSGTLNIGTSLGTGELTVGPGASVQASVMNIQGQVVLEGGTLGGS